VERLFEKSRLNATLNSVADAQRALLEVTRRELEKVEKQLKKCVPNNVTSKASWVLSRKEDIDLSLKFLGDRNEELRKLRTEQVHLIQISPNEEKVKVKDTQRIAIQSAGLRESSDLSPSNISGFQVSRVRRFARQLQRSLWPTICNYHHYDLKLLGTANDDIEDHSVPVNFIFVVTDTAPTYLIRTGYLIKTSATQESQTTTIITDLYPRTSSRSRPRKPRTDFMGILKDSHQKYMNSVHNDSISTRRLSRISLSDRLSRFFFFCLNHTVFG
jgi:hypothetical protein